MSDGYYGGADPDFVGVIPVRQDILVLSADNLVELEFDAAVIIPCNGDSPHKNDGRRKSLGFTMHETIGIGVINTRGLTAAQKTATVKE